MKRLLAPLIFCLISLQNFAQTEVLERNKKIAEGFYNDLWFTRNTEKYADYMADEYIIHDIGGEDGLTEAAVTQQEIADFFWENGNMSGKIDYQIADGDLVATRWQWSYEPKSMLGSFLVGEKTIPIINVFRIRDGKITEVWNHRHDIDMNRTNIFVLKGLGYGLLIALIPFIWAIQLRRKLKRAESK